MSLHPMYLLWSLILGGILLSGCDPVPDRQAYQKGVQLDELLYWSGDEEKVRSYLNTLRADLVYLSEVSYPPEEDRDEDEEVTYSLNIYIDNSDRLREKPDSSLEQISKRMLRLIAGELNYVEFYEDCQFSYLWHAQQETPHREAQFSFNMEDYLLLREYDEAEESEYSEYESYE